MYLLLGPIALTIAFLLPGHYPPWTMFEQQAAAMVALGFYGLGAIAHPRSRRLDLPALGCLVFAMSAIPWLQWILGQFPFLSDAALPSLYLLLLAVSICIGRSLPEPRAEQLITGLTGAFVVAGVLSTALAAMQWCGVSWEIYLSEMPLNGRPFANLEQPNHLATLLCLSSLFVLRLFERGRLSGAVAFLLVGLFEFGLALTQSRTGWLIAALVVSWRLVIGRRAGLKLSVRAAVAGLAIGATLQALVWRLTPLLLLAPTNDVVADRLQAGTRWDHWRVLVDALGQSPWTGFGWNQISVAQQAAALNHPATHEWIANAHNLILDLLVSNGLPLGLAIVAGMAIWIAAQIRACGSLDQWILLAAVGALLCHAMLEYPLDYAYFLVPFGLIIGRLDALAPAGFTLPIPRPVFALVLIAIAGALLVVASDYVQIREAVQLQRFADAGIETRAASRSLDQHVRVLDLLRSVVDSSDIEPHEGMSADEVRLTRDVALRYPTTSALLRYALAAGLNGNPDGAGDALKRLCQIHRDDACASAIDYWLRMRKIRPVLGAVPLPARDPAAPIRPGR